MRKYLLILVCAAMLLSCRPCKEISTYNSDTLVFYRDSTIVIPADSVFISAYFDCDSTNKVVMSELEVLKGRKVIPLVQFRDHVLTVDCKVDSQKIYMNWKERYTSTEQVITNTIVQKVKPKWLVLLAYAGSIALLLVLGLIISKVVKIVKPL